MAELMNHSKRDEHSRVPFIRRESKPNRADIELNIGLEAKKKLDSNLTTLVDAPSMKCVYYSMNYGLTTYSENTNTQKHRDKTTKFNKIYDFVLFGVKNKDETETKDASENEVNLKLTEQECLVLQGSLTPVPGDQVILESQQTLAVPYEVTNVETNKLVDKPVYIVTLSQSVSFTRSTLEDAVVDEYDFLMNNIGTGRKTIILRRIFNAIERIKKVALNLDQMYVDTFYNEKYDLLMYPTSEDSSIAITCRALTKFQELTEVLTYGNDRNTLFTSYPFVSKRELANYRKSYIYDIIKKRKSRPKPNHVDFPTLTNAFNLMDAINDEQYYNILDETEYDKVVSYTVDRKYSFYSSIVNDFNILTNFHRSGLVIYELNSTTENITDTKFKPSFEMSLNSKIFGMLFDWYDSNNTTEIINSHILDEYLVDSASIEDYLFIPVVIYIIYMTIDELTYESMGTNY